jgi:acyl carrier protein
MQTPDDITVRLRRVFAEAFEVNGIDLPENPTPDNCERWDSLGHVVLILAIEEEFDVKFTTEQIGKLKSMTALREAITAGKGAASA